MAEPDGSSTGPLLPTVIALQLLLFVFTLYLELRQRKAIRLPKLPDLLTGLVSDEKFKASQAYCTAKNSFGIAHSFFSEVETILSLSLLLLPQFWSVAGSLVSAVGLDSGHEIYRSLAFLLLLGGWNMVLELPFSAYSTFVIEQQHGFNKQSPALFMLDLLKSVVLGIVLMLPLTAVFITIVKIGGPFVALYLWIAVVVFALALQLLYPVAIAPLFNKFWPLPAGELRTKIEDLATQLKFPLKKLLLVDGSARSAHSNAYLYGFGKSKRIVLYDTLLTQCSNDEVLAVVAHELGHWKLRHTFTLFMLQQGLLLLNCLGFTLALNRAKYLCQNFGFSEEVLEAYCPVVVTFLLHNMIRAPLDSLLMVGFNWLSRRFEYQADMFAYGLGHGKQLEQSLIKLQEENMSSMNNDALYCTCHFSHPTLPQRLLALRQAATKEAKKE